MADFHFDFDAVQGMSFEDGMRKLLEQFEDHYNASQSSFVFGGSRASGKPFDRGLDMTPPPSVTDSEPVVAAPAGPVDTDTITPKTHQMKTFSIKDGKDLGLREGDTILKGVTDKGVEVFDKLLPGYDQQPYGPVVQGESGRYNIAPPKKGK